MFSVNRCYLHVIQFGILTSGACLAEIAPGLSGFKEAVEPFFEKNCVECHGEKKKKGRSACMIFTATFHPAKGSIDGKIFWIC